MVDKKHQKGNTMIEIFLELNAHLKSFKINKVDKLNSDKWIGLEFKGRTFRISRDRLVWAKPVRS